MEKLCAINYGLYKNRAHYPKSISNSGIESYLKFKILNPNPEYRQNMQELKKNQFESTILCFYVPFYGYMAYF